MESETINKQKASFNLILGLTGSVASIKINELIENFIKKFTSNNIKLNLCIIPTKNAQHFMPNFQHAYSKSFQNLEQKLEFLKIKEHYNKDNCVFYFLDEDEWTSWSKRNDPVLHIDLRKWADMLLIAPLDANTLGKITNGLCDNLLTSVLRAWDIENIKLKPIVICPAMNTCMYKHPITKKQLDFLIEELGFTVIDSISKLLMCQDVGIGAMASVETIVERCFDIYSNLSIKRFII
jgi:phosphopantothenoylcysteine decarboxylase